MSIITEKRLRSMADSARFQRGQEYHQRGAVIGLRQYRGRVSATVAGSRDYKVRLWEEDGTLKFECSCPDGMDYAFCKHCVAVGLALLAEAGSEGTGSNKSTGKTSRKKARQDITAEDIHAWLEQQDAGTLADLLVAQAMDDQNLYRTLQLKVAGAIGGDANISAVRQALGEAILPGYFIEYHDAYEYAGTVSTAIDAVEDLLHQGQAEAVIELTEFGLHKAEEAMDNIDDSSGHMHLILENLQALHLAACEAANPDPQALAERLFEWELTGEWEVFSGAAARYAGVLGERGLKRYRELAQEEWRKLKPLTRAAGKPADYKESYRRRGITHIMQTLAQQTGDVEDLVEVLRHDLSEPYSFLRIAEAYKKAKKYNNALEWAERGIKTFPDTPDSRLLEFTADEYHRRKRHDEAVGLIWQLFTDRPGLEQYRQLKQHASRGKQWPHWRQQAMDHLLGLLENKPGQKKPSGNFYFSYAYGPRSVLVEIHLWEDNVDAAWELAQGGELHEGLWLELADKRAQQHPDDAIRIYRHQVESAVGQTKKNGYSEAVRYLQKIRTLMTQSGREKDFSSYLETVRATHKRKRSFIAMIERL
ncbi:MAG: hypothetical protein F4147_03390 [Gammaproteobacteria bacterium]|nr:hypothetical protein [Gammaproteobacteria bacterium]